jgi:hypothetical protein
MKKNKYYRSRSQQRGASIETVRKRTTATQILNVGSVAAAYDHLGSLRPDKARARLAPAEAPWSELKHSSTQNLEGERS